jgi:hypothetical protein
MACLHSHRGEAEVWLQYICNLRTSKGKSVSTMHWQLLLLGKTVPTAEEARWALEPIWMDTENLDAIGIQSPDRPAHS